MYPDNQYHQNIRQDPPPTPLTSNVAPINSHETPKQKGNVGTIVLALFVLIALGVLGYWYQNYYNSKSMSAATPTPASTETPNTTADWNTYTNVKYKYSIKYPQNFTNNQSIPVDTVAVIFKPDSYANKTISELLTLPEITLDIVPNSTSLQDSLNQIQSAGFNKVTNITNIKINNIDSIQFNLTSSRSGSGNPSFDVLIETGSGNILHMSLSNYQADQKMLDTFNQMISTYKNEVSQAMVPADAQTPAAGTCPTSQGTNIMIVLNPDVPSPRCVQVNSGVYLSLANNTNSAVSLDYGGYKATIQPKSGYTFPGTIGTIFAPGVHIIKTSLYAGSGPEVWLK